MYSQLHFLDLTELLTPFRFVSFKETFQSGYAYLIANLEFSFLFSSLRSSYRLSEECVDDVLTVRWVSSFAGVVRMLR